MSDEIISTVNAEPVANVEPQQIEIQNNEPVNSNNEPVNAGNGEVTTPVKENKPVQSAEENARFAEVRRKAEAEARDRTIADLGYTDMQGNKITTYDHYMKAKSEAEQYEKEQKIREEYESKGLPDELIEELVESKRDREERQREKQAKAEQDKKNAEYQEFFEYFKAENGRDFNSATDTIPQDVWDLVTKGKTLTDAYAYNVNKQLKAKIAELEGKQKAAETNAANASSSTGSVTGNGSGDSGFISFEAFEANKHNQRWVIDNLSKISESRAKW